MTSATESSKDGNGGQPGSSAGTPVHANATSSLERHGATATSPPPSISVSPSSRIKTAGVPSAAVSPPSAVAAPLDPPVSGNANTGSKQATPRPKALVHRLSALGKFPLVPRNFRKGSSQQRQRQSSNPHNPDFITSPPLGLLCVRVLAARNLTSKDRNGRSDPFLILRVGDSRAESEVAKACLSPTWGSTEGEHVGNLALVSDGSTEREAVCVAPVWRETLDRTKVEVICWDKDSYKKNEYLGEISLTLEEWAHERSGMRYDANDNAVSLPNYPSVLTLTYYRFYSQ